MFCWSQLRTQKSRGKILFPPYTTKIKGPFRKTCKHTIWSDQSHNKRKTGRGLWSLLCLCGGADYGRREVNREGFLRKCSKITLEKWDYFPCDSNKGRLRAQRYERHGCSGKLKIILMWFIVNGKNAIKL